MEQVELAKNKDASQVVISLGMPLPDVDELFQQGREFKSIVLDWFSKRGKAASEIMLLIITAPENFKACIQFLEQLYNNEVELNVVFQQVSFSFTLTDGKSSEAYAFPKKV